MKKKFRTVGALAIALLLTASLAIAPTTVRATEMSDKELANYAIDWLSQSNTLSKDDMKSFGIQGEQISAIDASMFYDSLAAMDIAAFSQLKYELPTNVSETTALNYQYESMKYTMQSLGYGEAFEFNVPEVSTGYASDITTVFAETYGDLSHKFDANTSIPDGWSMSEIMGSAQNKRDQYASDIKNTDEYKAIKSSIGNSKVLVQTQKVIDKPDLKSALSLQTLITDSMGNIDDGTWIKEEWSAKDGENLYSFLETVTSNATRGNEYFSTWAGETQELFTSNKGKISSWLTSVHQSGKFTQAYNGLDTNSLNYDGWFEHYYNQSQGG